MLKIIDYANWINPPAAIPPVLVTVILLMNFWIPLAGSRITSMIPMFWSITEGGLFEASMITW